MDVPEKIGLIHHNVTERRSRWVLHPDPVYPRALYFESLLRQMMLLRYSLVKVAEHFGIEGELAGEVVG